MEVSMDNIRSCQQQGLFLYRKILYGQEVSKKEASKEDESSFSENDGNKSAI